MLEFCSSEEKCNFLTFSTAAAAAGLFSSIFKKRTNICLFQRETPKLLFDFIHFLPRTKSSSKLDTNHMSHMDACVTWCKFAVLNAALLTASHVIRSAPLPF